MKILISLMLLSVIFSSCRQVPEPLPFPWKPYSQQALADAVAHQKPVVIDFSAEWCPNCHELDRQVFSRPDIQAKLAQVVALRADLTDQDDPKVQQLAEQYNIEGVPTVIFLDKHGKEIDNSRVIGFVMPQDFSQSLAQFDLLK